MSAPSRASTPSWRDAFLAALEHRYAPSTRRTLRSIVSGVLQIGVLHEALTANPVRELDRIEQPKGHAKKKPRGLTVDERQTLLKWFDQTSDDARIRRLQRVARAAELPELVRLSLGTGLRIGEALAVRRLDVNLDGVSVRGLNAPLRVPVVTIAGNVTWVKGKGLVRQNGKSEAALRVVPLPRFAADLLRERLAQPGEDNWALFPAAGRDGHITYRYPSNVRRALRSTREEVGLGWMTPHTWRRTYATILDDEITLTDLMKADLMGQANFLKNTYVSRGELHAGAAVLLDAALVA